MGLNEFLIPREAPTRGDLPMLDSQNEILVAPPINSDEPETVDDSMSPDLRTAIRASSTLKHEEREASGSHRPTESIPSPQASAVIISPTLVERIEPPIMPSVDSTTTPLPPRLAGPPTSTSLDVGARLDRFLADFREASTSPSAKDVDDIDRDFISPSPLMEKGWSPDIHTVSSPAVMNHRSTGASDTRLREAPRFVEGLQETSQSDTNSDRWSGVSDFGDDYERTEGRLSQLADRLERVVERLAATPQPIGSRHRSFRGRIDG